MRFFSWSLFLALPALFSAHFAPVHAGSLAPPQPSSTEHMTPDGNLVVEVDLDGDKRPEVFNYYKVSGESRLLFRKEIDLNRDGRVDMKTWYTETGLIEKEEMDGDFDGRFDWTDHYKGGKRVMSENDSSHTGRMDVVRYYENGKTARVERDTNRDGKTDYWEYLDVSGRVVKVGRDLDGDGQMDVREE
jgi:antitoxin component YwqK of YwqJK toxin-antitoxin module